MKIYHILTISCLLMSTASIAQNSERIPVLDGVVERTLIQQKAPLAYEKLREADVAWEKKIWRIVDVREKMNLTFTYPKRPFFNILQEAIATGKITAYDGEKDDFSMPLSTEEAVAKGVTLDTITTWDPVTYDEILKPIRNEVDYTEIKRFRIKEVWYFDEESARMKVRLLGIAPIVEVVDENGNFKYEQVLYWAYYPELRQVLASEQAPHLSNDANPMTWENLLEMRYFSSYVYKASNIRDERIQDYISGGRDRLLEADKLEREIFNLEQDLWSY
ncbi:MAG: gliding motility protein GldN [Bacteroidota bacterium]